VRPAVLPIDQLHPNDYNPNKMTAFMYGKALESIKEFGFVDPVTVFFKGPDYYVIIDGEHRVRAAIDLGYTEVPCMILGDLHESQLPKLTIILNELKGQSDPEKLSDVLAGLLDDFSVEEVLVGMPYTEDILKGYLGFRDLKLPEDTAQTRGSEVPQPKEPWVERLFKVPNSVGILIDDAIARSKANAYAEEGVTLENWQALERILADWLSG
jgi:ParB-like chromosome segregation protein Spo0J